jgi:hypothetical protein
MTTRLMVVFFVLGGAFGVAGCSETGSKAGPSSDSGVPAFLGDGSIEGVDMDVWDVDKNGVPRVIVADYIDVDRVGQISLFRSAAGHDYSDTFENCRSMKHYFVPRVFAEAASIRIHAPFAGRITRLMDEGAGIQVHIQSTDAPAVTAILFHVAIDASLELNDHVTAGQLLGTHIGPQTASDVAVAVNSPRGFMLVSYFDAMTDALFAGYASRGIRSRGDIIITAAARDADPLMCDAGAFTNRGTLPLYLDLTPP